MSAVSGAVISTIALRLAMKNIPGSAVLSIGQAMISNSLGMIIYFYSQSGAGLARLGAKVDKLCDKQHLALEEKKADNLPARRCATSSSLIMMKSLLGVAVVINTASNAISMAQQMSALGREAHNAGSMISDELFDFSKAMLITTASVSGLSFVSGFVTQLYADFEKYMLTPTVPLVDFEVGSEEIDFQELMAEENTGFELRVRVMP